MSKELFDNADGKKYIKLYSKVFWIFGFMFSIPTGNLLHSMYI